MPWRYLPPAHSPVSLMGLLAGLRSAATAPPADLSDWVAARYGADLALLVDSGTSALRLAVEAASAGREAGAVIAVPAYGCYDLATAALGAGVRVHLYDLDPVTLGPDYGSLARVLASRPAALVIVHLFGVPVDIDRVRALISGDDIPIIEDAAQGAGAGWGGRRLGALGDLGVLSFGRGKGMAAGGGGAVLVNSARGRDRLARLTAGIADGGAGLGALSRLAVQRVLGSPFFYRLPAGVPWLRLGETLFHEPWPVAALARGPAGVLQDAVLLAEAAAEQRRANASQLVDVLHGVSGVGFITPPPSVSRPGWLRFPLLLGQSQRAAATSPAGRALGFMPGYPRPLDQLGPWRHLLVDSGAPRPGAERLAAQLVTAPTHEHLRQRDFLDIRRLLLG